MSNLKRPSVVPFVLVVGSAAVLVTWNSLAIARVLRSPAAAPIPSLAGKLEPLASSVEELLENQRRAGTETGRTNRSQLAAASGKTCEIRHRRALERGAASGAGDALARVDSALAAACAIQQKLPKRESRAGYNTLAAELAAHLNEALAAVRTAQVRLIAGEAQPVEPGKAVRLRDPLIGLACGLLCLLFARLPKAVAPSTTSGEEWPVNSEPANYESTALQLTEVDSTGSFFFCEVFDRAPVALVLLDGEGRIVRLNAEAERLAGRSTEELRHAYYWEALLPESDREPFRNRFPPAGNPTGETWIAPGGAERRLTWSRAFFKDGKSGRVALVLQAGQADAVPPRDDEKVRAAAQGLENELTMISGYCQLFAECHPAPGAGHEDLEALGGAAERAMSEVRSLLAGLQGNDRRSLP